MVATRLGWSALARSERVEGHRERWEDVVARQSSNCGPTPSGDDRSDISDSAGGGLRDCC